MSTIKLFETKQVRSLWDQDKEAWYFSIVDVISVLTDSVDAAAYWRKLKQWLARVGYERIEKTDEWENRGVQKGQEFAILTDEITKAWSGLSTREYKQVKGFEQNRKIAKQGGTIAGNTRKEIELKTGKPVVSTKNAKLLNNQ